MYLKYAEMSSNSIEKLNDFRFNSETNWTSSQIAGAHESAIFERVQFVSKLKQKTV